MSWIAAAIAGGSIAGSLISSNASGRAANTQANSARDAQQLQLQMFQQNKQDLAPWMQSGQIGNAELMRLLGIGGSANNPTFDQNALLSKPFGMSDFQADPGYQFRLQEGENALLNKRSAMGGILSGGTLKDLTSWGQGMASNEYQSAYNRYNTNIGNIYGRLSALSGTGANAAGGIAGLGANAASQAGNFGVQAGNAQAAGIVGQNNALMGGAGSLMNQWLQANALQQDGGWGMPGMNGAAPGYMQMPQQSPGWISQG